MVTVTNGEMLSAIMARLDSMEAGLNKRIDGLEERMDSLEARMDKMESDNAMEFKAIRIEMDVAYKMLSRDIASVNDKVDRFLHTKDIEGYESMRIQVDLLTQGYQELKAKIS